MIPNASAVSLSRRGSNRAVSAANLAPCPSNTTSADKNAASASRSCTAASRTGVASQPGTTGVKSFSSPPLLSPPARSSDCDYWVLSLDRPRTKIKTSSLSELMILYWHYDIILFAIANIMQSDKNINSNGIIFLSMHSSLLIYYMLREMTFNILYYLKSVLMARISGFK